MSTIDLIIVTIVGRPLPSCLTIFIFYFYFWIRLRTDRSISEKWLARAKTLQGRDVNVLRHRNNFMKYFLGLMKEVAVESGETPRCCKWGVSVDVFIDRLKKETGFIHI